MGWAQITDLGSAEAHHLISSEVTTRPLIKQLFERIGFDPNRFSNGIMLPARDGILGASKRSVHNGGHEGYRDAIASKLEDIARLARSKGDKWAISKIKEMQSVIRGELRKGTLLDPMGSMTTKKLQNLWEDALLKVTL